MLPSLPLLQILHPCIPLVFLRTTFKLSAGLSDKIFDMCFHSPASQLNAESQGFCGALLSLLWASLAIY